MKYDSVIFDLDGTLLNTLPDMGDTMDIALRRWNYATHPHEVYKYFIGEGMYNFVKRSLPENKRQEAVIQEVLEVFLEEYARNWSNRTVPYPGIEELLDGLDDRKILYCILSNKPHEFTTKVVSHYFPRRNFALVYGARPEFPPKPDPEAALELARELSLAPERTLYLGDTEADMRMAVAANLYPVGAAWGFRTREELLKSGARDILEAPTELLKYFP